MASVDAQLAQLQGQLNDLARAMTVAQQTGQAPALAMFKAQFRTLSAQAATLRTQANTSDNPGLFLRALTAFSDQAIKVGNAVGEPVGDLLHSTSTVLRLIPVLLVVVVVGIVWWALKGNLRVKV